MKAGKGRARLISDILASAAEAISLEDIGRHTLPLFERLVGSSRMLMYRSLKDDAFVPIAGAQECLPEYVSQFAAQDPLQNFLHCKNPVLLSATRCRAWREFRENRPLVQFYNRWELSRLLHLRLTDTGHMQPGHAAIVCGRSARQPDFEEADLRAAQTVLPALRAALRRSTRVSSRLDSAAAVEALFERGSTRALLAFDLQGKLLWISSRAEKLLAPHLGAARKMPESLLLAVKQVAALAEKGPQPAGTQPPYRWTLAQTSGQLLEGELYLERSAAGPFVAADFGSDRVAPNLLEIAQSRRLTPAETEVLSDLVRGCSDAEIAGHRFVSMATVRTHVTRVIQKLGVRSRLQAAALALGASPTKENLNQKL